jgi:hypothetical protein
MSTGSTAILPTATLNEDAWEDLLSYIEERRVIPIVGPELLQVATDRGPRQLYDWVAEKLAARLSVDRSDLPERYTLNRFSELEGHAEYALGAFTAAAQAERSALQAYKGSAIYVVVDPRRIMAGIDTWLSMALAHAGERDEAAGTIGLVVALYRALEKKNHGDQWLPLELAGALYAQSLTDDAHHAALLREAAQRAPTR